MHELEMNFFLSHDRFISPTQDWEHSLLEASFALQKRHPSREKVISANAANLS